MLPENVLIEARELYQHLSDKDTVVIDCRFQLGKPDDGRKRYESSHIPGAYYFDLEQDLSGPKDAHGGRHPLPDVADLAAKLSRAGVTDASHVIVYDDGEGMAPRAWWLIRYLGHDACSILNGGFRAWKEANFPLESTVPQPRSGRISVHLRKDWVATVDEVQEWVKQPGRTQLIDARAENRYRGDVEPIDKVAGHIPGAVNAPWMEGIDDDGKWRNSEEQRRRFEAWSDGRPLVMYCGSGVTACANLFALELAGIRGARLYAGSWSDWCSYTDHPVERGSGSP